MTGEVSCPSETEIAFIHPDYPGSEGTGATHSATQIIHTLKEIGYDVTTYCTSTPQDEDEEYRTLDVEKHSKHTAIGLNKAIRNNLAEFKEYDILHSYLPRTIPGINYIAKETSVSTAVTLNSFGGVCPKNDLLYMGDKPCRNNSIDRCLKCTIATSGGNPKYGQVYRSISRVGNLYTIKKTAPETIDIDGFQALSDHLQGTYIEFGYPEEKIKTIPNILDERFLVDHQSDFSEPYRLLYVGALEKHKGVAMLPAIVEHLSAEEKYEFELDIVGSGSLRSDLGQKFTQKNITDKVNFLGQLQNSKLPEIYASHDLFVYPGIFDEAFGRVFLESLAAGTPVVGTNVGAVESIVGSAGEVTRPDPQELADKITQILHSSSKAKRMSEFCKNEVEQYSTNEVKTQFTKLYQQIQK